MNVCELRVLRSFRRQPIRQNSPLRRGARRAGWFRAKWIFVKSWRVWSVLRTFDFLTDSYPDLAVWANSLDGPPDLPGEEISGDHPVAPRHPSVEGNVVEALLHTAHAREESRKTTPSRFSGHPSQEGNESGFQVRTPQSGGAAKGFNPGSGGLRKPQKGGALARGLSQIGLCRSFWSVLWTFSKGKDAPYSPLRRGAPAGRGGFFSPSSHMEFSDPGPHFRRRPRSRFPETTPSLRATPP